MFEICYNKISWSKPIKTAFDSFRQFPSHNMSRQGALKVSRYMDYFWVYKIILKSKVC